eukprot:jgi/Bigna1/125616/aug1.1_g324
MSCRMDTFLVLAAAERWGSEVYQGFRSGSRPDLKMRHENGFEEEDFRRAFILMRLHTMHTRLSGSLLSPPNQKAVVTVKAQLTSIRTLAASRGEEPLPSRRGVETN